MGGKAAESLIYGTPSFFQIFKKRYKSLRLDSFFLFWFVLPLNSFFQFYFAIQFVFFLSIWHKFWFSFLFQKQSGPENVSAGCSSDLAQATGLCRRMVMNFGTPKYLHYINQISWFFYSKPSKSYQFRTFFQKLIKHLIDFANFKN